VPPPVRLLFLGTSEFAVPVLGALCSGPSVEVAGVVTRPARPAGRGRNLRQPPVALEAMARGLPLHQPEKLRRSFRETLGGIAPDVMVSAAYGAYLPEWLLESARLGVVNVHPSLLPRHRGAAPVARTIISGDLETGVTFMLTDSGWDTGPVLGVVTAGVRPDDTAGSLERRLSGLAAGNVTGIVAGYASGEICPVPQQGEATYAEKITPDETWLDWTESAGLLERLVRAYQPAPGARTLYRGRTLKIHSASVCDLVSEPGMLYLSDDGGLSVGCGQGRLTLLEVQPEGGRTMGIDAFVRGYRPVEGEACGKR